MMLNNNALLFDDILMNFLHFNFVLYLVLFQDHNFWQMANELLWKVKILPKV